MSIYKIHHRELNVKLAEELKKLPEFKVPEWSFFVKSSVSRERPPADEDFWYKRAASILRQVYIKRNIGINKLRTRYGGKQDRGQRRSKFKKGCGKIIRTIMNQAEQSGLVEKVEKRGRQLTDKGKLLIEGIK